MARVSPPRPASGLSHPQRLAWGPAGGPGGSAGPRRGAPAASFRARGRGAGRARGLPERPGRAAAGGGGPARRAPGRFPGRRTNTGDEASRLQSD